MKNKKSKKIIKYFYVKKRGYSEKKGDFSSHIFYI
jgi:hypothetical protein